MGLAREACLALARILRASSCSSRAVCFLSGGFVRRIFLSSIVRAHLIVKNEGVFGQVNYSINMLDETYETTYRKVSAENRCQEYQLHSSWPPHPNAGAAPHCLRRRRVLDSDSFGGQAITGCKLCWTRDFPRMEAPQLCLIYGIV
jgi:hypothetical protein